MTRIPISDAMRRTWAPMLAFCIAAVPVYATVPVVERSAPMAVPAERLLQESMSGGPPPDGIPSIDNPSFTSAERAANWLDDDDVIFGVVVNGEARAYPQRILVWHEIVNDKVGGKPLAVTYCPLTGTAIGFQRGDTTFGVSGSLVNSNLIMYDRAEEGWWPQVLGVAIEGPRTNEALREYPVVWTTFGRWTERYPDSEILTRDTGHVRNYSRDPYGEYNPPSGYYADGGPIFPVLHEDDRLEPKQVVIGARTGDGAVAFKKDKVRDSGVVDGEVGGVRYTAVYDAGLDTVYVFRNPDGRDLTPGHLEWNADGARLRDAGAGVNRVNAFDAMWFAWAAFYPDSTLVR